MMGGESDKFKCESCGHIAGWQEFQCDCCNAEGIYPSGDACSACDATGYLCPKCESSELDINYKGGKP